MIYVLLASSTNTMACVVNNYNSRGIVYVSVGLVAFLIIFILSNSNLIIYVSGVCLLIISYLGVCFIT